MGYDTYLDVGDRTMLMWRKQTSALPRMLFRHDQALVTALEPDDDSCYNISVVYQTTAREALETLAASGLGWNASVAAYHEIRFSGSATGLVMGATYAELGTESDAEMRRRVQQFEALAPEHDLEALGTVMANQWADPEVTEVLCIESISYDQSITEIFTFSFEVYKAAAEMAGVDAFAATRAAESWALLYRDAPLIAWPILLVVFLKQLPSDTAVSLVLTEDAYETARVSTIAAGKAYADDYWSEASEILAGYARTLGRLFGVLAGFNSQLGREYWFARAADSLARIKSLTSDNSTTKERGDALEAVVEALVKTEEPELQLVERNFRTAEEEIDLVVANSLSDPFWTAQGSPLIFAECKNCSAKPGVPELRIFESKMRDRGAVVKIGIFISMSGFASTFSARLKSVQQTDGLIYAISGEDLENIVAKKVRLTDWLRGEGLMRALGKSSL